jgi:5-methylcytosine-specific restriction endonuclease McrA
MALARPCLDCGAITRTGSRCERCAARRDNWQGRRKIRSGSEWGEVRNVVRARDRVCVTCGATNDLVVHHRVPLAEGGTNDLANLALRCRRCHDEAHAVSVS